MTAFQRYKKYVLQKSIIISVSIGVAIAVIFALLLPVIEKTIPNADTAEEVTSVTVAVQEVENEQ